jgi:Flp pilus assembly protein TadG
MNRIQSRRSRQKGFAMVAFAAMAVGMIGFTGLAVDVGYLQYQKRRIQSAADAAAMGALREMERSQTDLVAAGQNDASLNGFTDGQNATTVTINNPPANGSYAGATTAVQAIVQRTVPTFFMQIFGQKGVTISAQAVAQTSNVAGSIGGCIFVLNSGTGPGAVTPAFKIHGTPQLETACSVVVNSSDNADALEMDGTSKILLDNNAKVGVVGGWTLNGNPQIWNNKTNVAESPVHIQSFTDPLASVPAPTAAGTTVQPQGGQQIDKNNAPAALNPGVYCGGLNIHSTSTTLLLNAGTYIIAGGGITIDAQANVQTAPLVGGVGGVMFYNTSSKSDHWGCTGAPIAAGNIKINGGSTLNLTALTTTDTTFPGASTAIGMLFFDDRSATGLSHQINGNAVNTFDGALYFPNAALTFTGTSSSGGYLVIVTNSLDIGGTSGLNSNLANDYTTLANVYTIAPGSTGGGLVQ